MKCADLVSGIFWLIIGLLLSIWSISYEIGTFKEPGSGFFPLGAGLLLILFSIILLVQLLVQGKKSSSISPKGLPLSLRSGWGKAAYTVFILLLSTFLFERIGYLVTIFLLVFFSIRVTGSRTWGKTLLLALLSTLGVYLIFVLLLKQQLPRSPFGI